LDLTRRHPAVLRLPIEICRLRDPTLPAPLSHLPAALNRLQYPQHLALAKPSSLHLQPPFIILSKPENSTLPWYHSKGSLHLDQNGIKFLSEKYFLELEKMSRTDFLYFVSASYFWRFGDKKEFKNHLDIDMQQAKKNPYQFIHRSIIKQLK